MSSIIEDRSRKSDPIINSLLVMGKPEIFQTANEKKNTESEANDPKMEGTIIGLREGYGFIKPNSGGDNLFFYFKDLQNMDFDSLSHDDKVVFCLFSNEKGPCAKEVSKMLP